MSRNILWIKPKEKQTSITDYEYRLTTEYCNANARDFVEGALYWVEEIWQSHDVRRNKTAYWINVIARKL